MWKAFVYFWHIISAVTNYLEFRNGFNETFGCCLVNVLSANRCHCQRLFMSEQNQRPKCHSRGRVSACSPVSLVSCLVFPTLPALPAQLPSLSSSPPSSLHICHPSAHLLSCISSPALLPLSGSHTPRPLCVLVFSEDAVLPGSLHLWLPASMLTLMEPQPANAVQRHSSALSLHQPYYPGTPTCTRHSSSPIKPPAFISLLLQ